MTEKVNRRVGGVFEEGGFRLHRSFMAVTDPGSNMESVAKADNFRAIFYGKPQIGGRYSVLSNFGLVPAAVMGVDVARFLDRTEEMVQRSGRRSIPQIFIDKAHIGGFDELSQLNQAGKLD